MSPRLAVIGIGQSKQARKRVEPVWCPDGELAASMTSIRYYRPVHGAGGQAGEARA